MGATVPAPLVRPWLGGLYSPPRTPVIVDVPGVTYLVRTGEGPPEGNLTWAEAIDGLRADWRELVGGKGSDAQAERTPLLEVLWHDAEQHRWTLMLALDDPALRPHGAGPAVRHLHEGWCVQLMYQGAATRETALTRLDRFVSRQGYRFHADGVLHEIYLDDVAALSPRMIARRRVRPGG